MPYVNPDALIGNDQIRVVKTVQNKLRLSDDNYRAILWGVARASSCKGLKFREYWALMDRLQELGKEQGVKVWLGRSRGAGRFDRPSPAPGEGGPHRGGMGAKMRPFQEPVKGPRRADFNQMATEDQQKKIYALWEDFARNKSPQALKSFLQSRFRIQDMRWMTKDQASDVIEAMKGIRDRELSKEVHA